MGRYLESLQKVYQKAENCCRKGSDIRVIAISKGQSVTAMRALYQEGCRDFGESRVQEALDKQAQMPTDIRWHFIGSLQRNKVSKVMGRFALIHSVDSLDLAKKISELSQWRQLVTPILLQVNTSGEPSKHGFTVKEFEAELKHLFQLSGVSISGLMTMGPQTGTVEEIRSAFRTLHYLANMHPALTQLSMGMTMDYSIAIEEGATLLRLGHALFE